MAGKHKQGDSGSSWQDEINWDFYGDNESGSSEIIYETQGRSGRQADPLFFGDEEYADDAYAQDYSAAESYEDYGYDEEDYEEEKEGLLSKLMFWRKKRSGEEEEAEDYSYGKAFGAGSKSSKGYDDYGYEDEGSGLSSKIIYIVLSLITVIALVACVFAVATLLGGKGKSTQAEKTPESQPSYTQQGPSQAEMQAEGQLPGETAATPEPSGSKAVLTADGILVPGERGPVVPERDTPLPLEAFATTTMIGNSFVEGMKLWSDINCEYVCADGVSLDNMIGNYLYYVTVRDYDAIYLTLGLNEIGWPVDSFIEKYEKVIDYIRSDAYSKTATIYVTSVMPAEQIMETTPAESGQTIHLTTILNFNERLKAMCQEKGCWYIDVYSALADETGYLPADVAADDHVHFEKTGYRIWTDYLLSHYVDESLLEE